MIMVLTLATTMLMRTRDDDHDDVAEYGGVVDGDNDDEVGDCDDD